MKSSIKALLQSTFLKFSSIVFVGNLTVQLVNFLCYVLFARFFSLEDLAIYAIYVSICMVGAIFITGRYDVAIMLPKVIEKSFKILKLSLFVAISGSSIFLIAILVLSLISFKEFPVVYCFVPLSMFFLAASQAITTYHNKLKRFGVTSFAKGIQVFSMLILSMTLGCLMGWTTYSLVLALVCSHLLSFLYLLLAIKNQSWTFDATEMKEIALEYIRYPKYALSSDFLNVLSREIPNYIIPIFWGLNAETFYAYANRVANMPRNLISASAGEVFYKTATDFYQTNKADLLSHVQKVIMGLFGLAVIIYLPTLLFSEWFFPFAFGAEYTGAVPLYNWIAVISIILFVQTPISMLNDVLNQLKIEMIYKIVVFLIRIAVLGYAALFIQNIVHAITLYMLTNGLLALFWVAYLYVLVKREVKVDFSN